MTSDRAPLDRVHPAVQQGRGVTEHPVPTHPARVGLRPGRNLSS